MIDNRVFQNSCYFLNTNKAFSTRLTECTSHPLNVLFFGTDDFALKSLRLLHQNQKSGLIGRLDVVTVSLKKIKPAVLKYCSENRLQVHLWPVQVPENTYNIDIVVSFGYLLPESVISKFALGVLNVHGSLLPKYRGAAPIIHAIRNGETVTGITIMKIEAKRFDTGDILSQRNLEIPWNMKCGALTNQMAEIGAEELITTLENIDSRIETRLSQNNSESTKAPKIDINSSRVCWSEMDNENSKSV